MTTPFIIVIFGATGDLMQRKLLPTLFKLYKEKKLGQKFYLVGFARRPFIDSQFREMLRKQLGREWEEFSKNIYYQQGDFAKPAGYEELIKKLNQFDKEVEACITRFFYLATPPQHYETILNFLHKTKLSEGCGHPSTGSGGEWTRIIVEKPFGKDLETAKALDKKLSEIFEEQQIFRVDHYLGKETVQNIITFRFANGIFEPVWNKIYIDCVQITFAERKGVKDRGEFFDGVGMLRDVAQSHLMQLIAAVVMESPRSFSKEGVRNARAKAIAAIRCINPEEVDKFVVRGQYDGYRSETEVAKDSETETFVAMKLFVDTERFSGIPFYVRAGKKMPKDEVSISVIFIQTCHILFKEYGCPEVGNVLTIRIQPDEGTSLRVIAKKPGLKLSLETVDLKFSYKEEFGEDGKEAYEKILLDIFAGDQMLFNRSDELESSWEFITRILEGWSKSKPSAGWRIPNYEPGSWGPKEADELIEKDGRKWI